MAGTDAADPRSVRLQKSSMAHNSKNATDFDADRITTKDYDALSNSGCEWFLPAGE
ncbi:MAG: hypothetical protein ACRD2S_02565 [Terriglobales bacterium]